MLRVGITGGIGSGKSVVARIFATLGVPVYDADAASKRLMNESEEMRNEIIRHFGSEAYKNGILDRAYLSQCVFGNTERLDLLNAIVHPATKKDGNDWMMIQEGPYALKEAAIIFESNSHLNLDKIIGVYAPEELRIQRTMKRNQLTREMVLARMAHQMNEEEKMALCDFVIVNDEKELVIPQVLKTHHELLAIAAQF